MNVKEMVTGIVHESGSIIRAANGLLVLAQYDQDKGVYVSSSWWITSGGIQHVIETYHSDQQLCADKHARALLSMLVLFPAPEATP